MVCGDKPMKAFNCPCKKITLEILRSDWKKALSEGINCCECGHVFTVDDLEKERVIKSIDSLQEDLKSLSEKERERILYRLSFHFPERILARFRI